MPVPNHSHICWKLIPWQLCFLAFFLLSVSGLSARERSALTPSLNQTQALARYLALPLYFEANQGQTGPQVHFLSRGSGYSLFLTQRGVVLNLARQHSAKPGIKPEAAPADTLRMQLAGANASAVVTGADPKSGVVSYFIGNDPKKWRAGIPTYGKVRYTQVYPGVDLVFSGNQDRLEYDFIVAPGADPSRIAWQIDGARVRMDKKGNVVLDSAHGSVSFNKPALYQIEGGTKVNVAGSFAVAANRIRFRTGSYDHSKALVIDPVLSFASYLAGSGSDHIGWSTGPGDLMVGSSQGLAVDSEGSVYVTGNTYSTDFPTKDAYEGAPPPKMSGVKPGLWPSIFVTKFSPDGGSLVYSTYLGGDGSDYAYAIAVDTDGNAYLTGETNSVNFPITPGAYEAVCSPNPTNKPPYTSECNSTNISAFVTKLNSTGTRLAYSTFLGGFGYAYATAIAVDRAGRAYVAGISDEYCSTSYTFEGCFPTTTGALIPGSFTSGRSPQYSFLAAFDPTGSELLYSTLFGDMNSEGGTTWGTGVAVDPQDYVYLIGETAAGKLPTTKGVIQRSGSPLDPTGTYIEAYRGFVAKFYPVAATGGTSLAYATYLGGHKESLNDYMSGITFDGDSNAYVVGYTNSPDFPVTTGAYSTVCGPNGQNCAAAHVTELNPSGTAILWSTFVGDSKGDGSDAVFYTGPIALDEKGNVYLTGQVGFGFPMVDPVEPNNPALGSDSVLVAELDPTGSDLLFSTTIGSAGLHTAEPAGLAVDQLGDIYLAGNHIGPGLITTPGAFQTKASDSLCCFHGFVARIVPHGKASVNLAVVPSRTQYGELVTLTATVSPSSKYASTPGGTITFLDGSRTLATAELNSSGVATFSSAALLPRTHSLTAEYSGDRTYPRIVSAIYSLTVKPAATSTALKATPNPAPVDQKVTLTATVAVEAGSETPAGLVTFFDGTKALSEVRLNASGTAIVSKSSFAAGSHTITAAYGGTSKFAASKSKAVILKINPKAAFIPMPATPASR
jgi:hypothetical protein